MSHTRTYESTHPWLTFSLDLNKFSHHLWLALGEATSKCAHIAGVPLNPDSARRVHSLYLAKGALATTAIEGNTLSEDEAQELLEGKLHLPPSRQYLGQEIQNIVEACNALTQEIAKDGRHDITLEQLCWMNSQVLKGLEVDEDVVPGEIRQHSVVVGRYRCAPPEDCRYLLERLCETLNTFPCQGEMKEVMAIVKSIFAHLYLVWIHPFGDGNGRTARLLELYLLLSTGFPQPASHLLSNHYNKTRSEYYRRLDAASRSPNGVIEFIQYAVQGFVDGLRDQIDFIRRQQWDVAWINYVHELFQHQSGASARRRRDLILWLSKQSGAVKFGKMADFVQNLPAWLAFEYQGKTPRTLQRDIEDLVDLELVLREKGGAIRANKEMILAFLPWSHKEMPTAPSEEAPTT